MRKLTLFALLAFCWQVSPVFSELAENAVHFLVEGHGAHALPDASHAPQGNEHGCSATFHVCPCHASFCFLASRSMQNVTLLPSPATRHLRGAPVAPCDGFFAGVFRPPIG